MDVEVVFDDGLADSSSALFMGFCKHLKFVVDHFSLLKESLIVMLRTKLVKFYLRLHILGKGVGTGVLKRNAFDDGVNLLGIQASDSATALSQFTLPT